MRDPWKRTQACESTIMHRSIERWHSASSVGVRHCRYKVAIISYDYRRSLEPAPRALNRKTHQHRCSVVCLDLLATANYYTRNWKTHTPETILTARRHIFSWTPKLSRRPQVVRAAEMQISGWKPENFFIAEKHLPYLCAQSGLKVGWKRTLLKGFCTRRSYFLVI